MDLNSDSNSADYETVKDNYMYVRTEPTQEYYISPRATNESAVKQDKGSDSEFERVPHPILQKGSMVQWIVLASALLVGFCALGLSIGALLNGVKHGNELKKMTAQFSGKTAADVLELLNNASATVGSCDECVHRTDQMGIYHMSTSQALNSLQVLYDELNRTVHEVDNTKQKVMSGSVDFTAGCISTTSTCVINHNNVGTPPASGVCETATHDVDVPGFRNVNIYCNIDNSAGETNPVTSTLNIYGGEVSCLCSLVALTAATATPECRLTIQRCPKMIMFNITGARSP
jgi:hypothetical protein